MEKLLLANAVLEHSAVWLQYEFSFPALVMKSQRACAAYSRKEKGIRIFGGDYCSHQHSCEYLFCMIFSPFVTLCPL